MAEELLSDGTISWIGGMDTSRHPADIDEHQYFKAVNVCIPESGGGLRARPGIHCQRLEFESAKAKEIFHNGNIQAEGSFVSNGKKIIIILIDGYIIKLTKIRIDAFRAELINENDRNSTFVARGWVIEVPGGCVVNNGVDSPIYITENSQRRTDASKGEIGIGMMGVYVQHRLFYVDQSQKRILASDFLNPIKFSLEGTNIFGFMCPDDSEFITAIGKQKSMLQYAEGGNLIWSSQKDIYSADVRGTRSDWADLGSRVGKTTETIPGFSAISPYSFESFNSNIYFRTSQFGMVDLKQSEYQFVKEDAYYGQSIEASYFLNNDTDWMLSNCYTKACNNKLYTTVAPETTDNGYVYWNGILSFNPSASYTNQVVTPRRYESVYTGVRPWCLTVVRHPESRDELYMVSYDKDKVNRLYQLVEDSDYDVNGFFKKVEIEGFIETRSYAHKSKYVPKVSYHRFYSLDLLERSVNITVRSRFDGSGEWVKLWSTDHLIDRNNIKDGKFTPIPHKPQTRKKINLPQERTPECSNDDSFLSVQYRFEFKGPINLCAFVVIAQRKDYDKVTSRPETTERLLTYGSTPTFNYLIHG
jgi:hypothetical protein